MGTKFIQIDTGDDEREVFYIQQGNCEREHIISTDHDEHGWSGMQAVRDALKLMAIAAGFEIVTEYDPEA